jgi:ribose transport system substrate-binding protein
MFTNLTNFLLSALLVFTISCNNGNNGSDEKSASDQKLLKIAVVPKGSTHSFWKTVQAGALKAGEELDIEVMWQGPQKEDDRQMQIQVVQNFTSRGVDAIVLAPLDDRSLVQPVNAAVKRNIPVVIIDSELSGGDFSSFVATDNYEGGKMCAKLLSEKLNGKGNVVMLRYQEGSSSTAKREQGFLDGLKEYGSGITVVSENQYAGATIEKAFQASQNLLNRLGDVNGIYCPNESTTQGMLRALQTAGKAGKVHFVGFDVNNTLLEALKKGEIDGLAMQDPYKMGYEGVKTAYNVVKKQPFDKKIDTGILIVTKENVESEDIQKVLKP